jgi:hypothetical protein
MASMPPAAPGVSFPLAVGSHVDDNMWKLLHILQDVRCPSGWLGLGTQGGLAFPASPDVCAFLSGDSPPSSLPSKAA